MNKLATVVATQVARIVAKKIGDKMEKSKRPFFRKLVGFFRE